MTCTICISDEILGYDTPCATHRTPALAHWERAYGDDIRDLRSDIAAGLVDFGALEMA